MGPVHQDEDSIENCMSDPLTFCVDIMRETEKQRKRWSEVLAILDQPDTECVAYT